MVRHMHKKIISFNDIFALNKLEGLSKAEKRAKVLEYKKMVAGIEETKDNAAQLEELNKEIDSKLWRYSKTSKEDTKTYYEACNKYRAKPSRQLLKCLKQGIGIIHIRDEKIAESGAQAMAEALNNIQRISIFLLEGNQLGSAGAIAIVEALKNNQFLYRLYLKRNHIGDEGARWIAEALKNNERLTDLFLSDNEIGDAGAEDLAEIMKTKKNLKTLYLDGNQIGDVGAKALHEAEEYRRAKGWPKVSMLCGIK
jgi:Ran GTPase-activating protein (RanGAP) involved in mRNA processing and transport